MWMSTFELPESSLHGGGIILGDDSTMYFEVYPKNMSILWSTDISSAPDALRRWIDAKLIPAVPTKMALTVQIEDDLLCYEFGSIQDLVPAPETDNWGQARFIRLQIMPGRSLTWADATPQTYMPRHVGVVCELPFNKGFIKPVVAATGNPTITECMDILLAKVASKIR